MPRKKAASPAPIEPARRGRPRPQDVIDRDEAVFTALAQPASRAELVERTGLTASAVYLSLWRLRLQERVARIASQTEGRTGHTWQRV